MNDKGFTLIELMVAVAIVGILAAIAYPSYTESVKKTRRAEVAAILLENVQIMERHYSQNGTYEGATIVATSPASGSAAYDIALGEGDDATTATTFLISASAVSGGVMYGDTCAALSINQLGERTGDSGICWRH